MKKLNFLFAALVCLLMHPFASCADDRPIPVDQLPASAKTFVQNYFPDLTIIYAEKDNSRYEARLSDGSEVEFNKKGEWTKVDRKTNAVPAALVPEAISAHVKSVFPDAGITMIEKERRGYEIELTNDIDMKFNKNGRFLEMGD